MNYDHLEDKFYCVVGVLIRGVHFFREGKHIIGQAVESGIAIFWSILDNISNMVGNEPVGGKPDRGGGGIKARGVRPPRGGVSRPHFIDL